MKVVCVTCGNVFDRKPCKVKDKSQDAYLKKCGYKVLRFWESEVKKEVAGESDYIRRTIRKITNGVKGVV